MYRALTAGSNTIPRSRTDDCAVSGSTADDGPSAAALAVTSPEVRAAVAALVVLPRPPKTTTHWADGLFTCTYHLPTGRLVLTVKESPSPSAASSYFMDLRCRLLATHPLRGPRDRRVLAYETHSGTVLTLAGSRTLKADVSGMPPVCGPHMIARADLAHEITADVLDCWNSNDVADHGRAA